MPGGLLLDECFKAHLTGAGHPESPQRLDAVRDALDRSGLISRLTPVPVTEVSDRAVLRIHSAEYVQRIARTCAAGVSFIDVPDNTICPRSYEIARLAAGSVLNAVDGVIEGRWQNAFCAVRPPGHHAERDRSMGFCLLNHDAIAVEHLIQQHGLTRVMVLDWDVHHGNGTQHSFEDREDVLFISLHGHPDWVYPGTGHEHEIGSGAGRGFTLNVPMTPGSGDDAYRAAFDAKVAPLAESFSPEFVVVTAGFDAHRRDPLAPIELETASFEWMTRWVIDLARRHCDGRLVSLLAGGYDLQALAECVAMHVELLQRASD